MPKISKRTLWGYTPASVDAVVAALQEEHEKHCQRLQTQLEELIVSNERLYVENAQLQEETQKIQLADETVALLLLQAHIEQTKAVYEMHEELEQMEEKQGELLEISQVHRESVVHQVLDKLRSLESDLSLRAKEGDHGGSSGI